MARPKRVFADREIRMIGLYALNGGKNQTIANAMEMPVNTLKNRFSKLLQKNRAVRKLKLAHNQTKQSKYNHQMSIFLGKNELGQTDKQIIASEQKAPELTPAERRACEEMAKGYKLRLARQGGPSQAAGA